MSLDHTFQWCLSWVLSRPPFLLPGGSVQLDCSVLCGNNHLDCNATWKTSRPYSQTHEKWACSIFNFKGRILLKSRVYGGVYRQDALFVQTSWNLDCCLLLLCIWERPREVLSDGPNLGTSAPAVSFIHHDFCFCYIFLSVHNQQCRHHCFYPSMTTIVCVSLLVTSKRTRWTASPQLCSPSTRCLTMTWALPSPASERV